MQLTSNWTDQSQLVTLYEYDMFGNRTRVIFPDETTQEWTYESTFSQVTSFTDELGRLTLYDIDPETGNVLKETRVVGQIDPAGSGPTTDT